MGLDRALRVPTRDRALPEPPRRSLRPTPRHPPVHRRERDDVRRRHRHLDRSIPTPGSGSAPASRSWRPVACRHPTDRRGRASTRSRARSCRRACGPRKAVELEGKRIGIVGTGSSGVQAIPELAKVGRAPHRVPAHGRVHVAVAEPAAHRRRAGRDQGPVPRAARRAVRVVQRHRGHDRRGDLRVPDRRASASSRARPRSARPRSRSTGSARAASGPTPRRTSTPTRWPSSCSARWCGARSTIPTSPSRCRPVATRSDASVPCSTRTTSRRSTATT